MAWTSLTFAFGSLLTSTKITQLYDNITALANGDSGAPEIVQAAIADDAIGYTQLKLAAVPGEVSTAGSDSLLTLAGGLHGFYPQMKDSGVSPGSIKARLAKETLGATFATYINLGTDTGTIYAQHQYFQSSPPYMIGNKQWGHFLYLLRRISDGVIVSSYSAEDPPHAYNGPPHNAKDSVERMAAVPHPFVEYWSKDPVVDGLEIVLVDLPKAATVKWVADNKKIGRGLLEDVGTILPSRGVARTPASYDLPLIPGFTDKIKIVTP